MSVAKRGRPKASSLPDLIREGEQGEGPLKCDFCYRLFPRMKSLMAHRRIHTDEKPYMCTYPGCPKDFRQSGQLKTHVRRHTGEKPFACCVSGCTQRFIHSSRQCPKHPTHDLIKDNREEIRMPENLSEEELQWFNEYKENKGKPAKRKILTNSENVVKQIKTEKCNSPSHSSSGVSFSGQSSFGVSFSGPSSSSGVSCSSPSSSSGVSCSSPSSSSGVSSFSEASTDSNCVAHEQERFQPEPQVNARQFYMPRDAKSLEAAEILCMFSFAAR